MKIRKVIKRIEQDDWSLIGTRDSHRQVKHDAKPGSVTFSSKLSDDVPPGTLNVTAQLLVGF